MSKVSSWLKVGVIGLLKGLAWGLPVSAAVVFTYALVTFDIGEKYSQDPQLEFSMVAFVLLTVSAAAISIWYEARDYRRKKATDIS